MPAVNFSIHLISPPENDAYVLRLLFITVSTAWREQCLFTENLVENKTICGLQDKYIRFTLQSGKPSA